MKGIKISKEKFKNVYRAYRIMSKKCTVSEALAWIGFYSQADRKVIEKVIR